MIDGWGFRCAVCRLWFGPFEERQTAFFMGRKHLVGHLIL